MAKKNVFPHIERGEKMADPIIGQAWHKDGTPFNKADYVKAGLTPPTDEQLSLWAQAEQAERERNRA